MKRMLHYSAVVSKWFEIVLFVRGFEWKFARPGLVFGDFAALYALAEAEIFIR